MIPLSLPNIFGTARLVTDPEIKFSSTGSAICKMRLVFVERKRIEEKWVDGATTFLDAVAFGQLGETAGDTLVKGNEVVVSGRLKGTEWKSKTGEKRTGMDFILDEIALTLRRGAAQRSTPTTAGKADPWTAPVAEPIPF